MTGVGSWADSFNKAVALVGQMTLAELEATAAWLERNRLCDHLHLLDGDARYAWTARQRGEWAPPVGRPERWNECRPPPGQDGSAQG